VVQGTFGKEVGIPAQGLFAAAASGSAPTSPPRHYRGGCASVGGVTKIIDVKRVKNVSLQGEGVLARLLAAFILVAVLPVADTFARDRGTIRDPGNIRAIVIHTVGGPACTAGKVQFRPIPKRDDDAKFWRQFLRSAPSADAHYVIGRTGNKAEALPVTQIANHTLGINPISIGIELVHRGDGIEPFEESQIIALIDLVKEIRQQYPLIPIENIVAHSEIDQRTCSCAGTTYRRRQDPGANFPMQRLLEKLGAPDMTNKASSLPRLLGSAPKAACVTEPR
jgi:N-acetyl-anhydromuramyl-L-alanine amidase AmpD